jgi:hypothetical protein
VAFLHWLMGHPISVLTLIFGPIGVFYSFTSIFAPKQRATKIMAQAYTFSFCSAIILALGTLLLDVVIIYYIVAFPFDSFPQYASAHKQYLAHPTQAVALFSLLYLVVAPLFVLLIALLASFAAGLCISSAKEWPIFQRVLRPKDARLLLGISLLLALAAILSTSINLLTGGFLFIVLSGFLFGSLAIRWTSSSKHLLKWLIVGLVLFTIIISALALFWEKPIQQTYLANQVFLVQIQSIFLIGATIGQFGNTPLTIVKTDDVSWKRVFFWLLIGIITTILLSLLFTAISLLAVPTAIMIGIGVGITGGQGAKLLKRIPIPLRRDTNGRMHFAIAWKRLRIALLLMFVYLLYFTVLGFAVTPISNAAPKNNDPFLTLTPDLPILLMTVYCTIVLVGMLGLLVGVVQAFGPRIQSAIEGWPERIIGIIGLVITLLLLLLANIVNLFS